MRIAEVDSFTVQVPLTEAQKQRRCYSRADITRVRTDDGLTGYGFARVDLDAVRAQLLGEDPFAVARHVEAGLHAHYGAENALWDIVGKAAGQSLHRLWGAYRDRLLLYLTCVWPGADDQIDVTPLQQAEDVARFAEQGYRAVKIRSWRPDPMDDVEAVRQIRRLVGGPERMEVMIDRTGQYSGTTWDYDTALRVARGLQEVQATWLEEPFTRGDIHLHARLRRDTDIAITGGEHQPFEVYAPYLRGEAFDIVQPHCANVLLHLRQVGAMAQMCGVQCIFHGSHGMDLFASLQVGATIPTCRMQELVYTTPPETPHQAWEPLVALVRGDSLYEVEDGYVRVPEAPGLGVELDEAALERYRVDG